MSTVTDEVEDVQAATVPIGFGTLPDDDAELAELVRSGFLGDFAGEPRLPFADWIEVQAGMFRLKGSDTAGWLASKLDELASWARRLQASTPADFDARYEIEQEAMVARVRAEGYDEAQRQARLFI